MKDDAWLEGHLIQGSSLLQQSVLWLVKNISQCDSSPVVMFKLRWLKSTWT